MNFKKVLIITVVFLMLTSLCASAKTLEFTMGNNIMYESDAMVKDFELENAPYTKNGRTMVPVRIISERFGAFVGWDEIKNEVSITKDDKTIILTLGSTQATVNGEIATLDVAPEELNGRTMVPLRFISETLGMDVKYIPSTEQVVISNEEAIMTINGKPVTIDDYKALMAYYGYKKGDNALEFVKSASETFQTVYGASTYLNLLGASSDVVYTEEVASNINPYKESIYSAGGLTAPLAELIENDMFLVEYSYSLLDTAEGAKIIEQKYENEYVTAKHILISFENNTKTEARKKAQTVLKQLKLGDDFDALMAEYGEDPGAEQAPDGYTFTKGEMVEEFEKAAFALKEGEISNIVETTYGYHIIKREPLAEPDYYTAYYLSMAVTEDIYADVLKKGYESSFVNTHMTDEQIAAYFN